MEKPTCLECGKVLRPYRQPKVEVATKFGRHGDNLFCGINCGYRWAVMAAKSLEMKTRGWMANYRKLLAQAKEKAEVKL